MLRLAMFIEWMIGSIDEVDQLCEFAQHAQDTLQYLDVNSPEDAPLLEALETFVESLRNECDCDHQVGVCYCDLRAIVDPEPYFEDPDEDMPELEEDLSDRFPGFDPMNYWDWEHD